MENFIKRPLPIGDVKIDKAIAIIYEMLLIIQRKLKDLDDRITALE